MKFSVRILLCVRVASPERRLRWSVREYRSNRISQIMQILWIKIANKSFGQYYHCLWCCDDYTFAIQSCSDTGNWNSCDIKLVFLLLLCFFFSIHTSTLSIATCPISVVVQPSLPNVKPHKMEIPFFSNINEIIHWHKRLFVLFFFFLLARPQKAGMVPVIIQMLWSPIKKRKLFNKRKKKSEFIIPLPSAAQEMS